MTTQYLREKNKFKSLINNLNILKNNKKKVSRMTSYSPNSI